MLPAAPLGADAKILSPSRPVPLAWALQLRLIANPAPLGAAAGGAEPVVVQVGTEAAATDLKPGRTEETTCLRMGPEKNHTLAFSFPPSVLMGINTPISTLNYFWFGRSTVGRKKPDALQEKKKKLTKNDLINGVFCTKRTTSASQFKGKDEDRL